MRWQRGARFLREDHMLRWFHDSHGGRHAFVRRGRGLDWFGINHVCYRRDIHGLWNKCLFKCILLNLKELGSMRIVTLKMLVPCMSRKCTMSNLKFLSLFLEIEAFLTLFDHWSWLPLIFASRDELALICLLLQSVGDDSEHQEFAYWIRVINGQSKW